LEGSKNALRLRVLTSFLRGYPNFLILGEAKCGTTSLFNYLVQHPQILPTFKKEVHFFDLNYHKGNLWYRAHFPTWFSMVGNKITGESSPYYLLHPLAPERVYNSMPEAKLIVMIRDPVKRAYSHYQHQVRSGLEHLTFEDAIEQEPKRLDDYKRKIKRKTLSNSLSFQRYSYLERGKYIDQLKNWLNWFDFSKMKIIKSEEFFDYPDKKLNEVFDFLGVQKADMNINTIYNTGEYSGISKETEDYLREYFQNYNEQLSKFLGQDFYYSS
jgi:hypothetical protein